MPMFRLNMPEYCPILNSINKAYDEIILPSSLMSYLTEYTNPLVVVDKIIIIPISPKFNNWN